jgi:copper chaperone
MVRTYRVTGMTCEGCVRAVTRAVTRAAPAARVGVDLTAGWLTIDGEAAPEAVARAVEDAGFGFGGAAS